MVAESFQLIVGSGYNVELSLFHGTSSFVPLCVVLELLVALYSVYFNPENELFGRFGLC